MLPKQDIEKYGGKAAILNHIREKLPDMPIPRYVVKEAGQSLDSILPDIESFKGHLAVRSSSPYEYGDFEGIFESVIGVHPHDINHAIKEVEESAASDRAKEYAKQNNFDIDEKINIILQEESQSIYTGAMMRHPNNPDIVFIAYYRNGENMNNYHTFVFDESTKSKARSSNFFSYAIQEDEAKFLVEQYKKIESLKDIAEGYSLFVEFGQNPFAVYQARPFKKVETADFSLPDNNHRDNLYSNFTFGITPPEGIVLPVVRSFGMREADMVARDLAYECLNDRLDLKGIELQLEMALTNIGMLAKVGSFVMGTNSRYLSKSLKDWHYIAEKALDSSPYCLMISSAQRDTYNTDLSIPHMKSLVLGGTEAFLVHNLMRLFKKSEITVGVGALWQHDFYKNLESITDKVRIISNGKEAVLSKE